MTLGHICLTALPLEETGFLSSLVDRIPEIMTIENSSTAAPRPQLSIEIYSDLICPWCYIGRRRLQQSLDEMGGETETVLHWQPFQLNPTMPVEGMDRKTYRSRKFGSWSRSQAMDEEVAAVGRSLGLEFNFDRVLKTPNTLLGHRLLWWAAKEGRQDALCDALFRAYFGHGLDLGDPVVLAKSVEEVDLLPSAATAFLESTAGTAEVEKKENEGRSQGISGVPFFVINGTAQISGAQPPSVFTNVFKQLMPVLKYSKANGEHLNSATN